jgi:uncharacterized membrane protein (DUF2068 family)
MRVIPRRWHSETWVCSLRGHVAPAARAARLRPEDDNLGEDLPDGTRVVRCLRCDLWLRVEPPGTGAAYEVIPPLDQIDLPLRGKPLESRIVLRLIAVERGLHVLVFGTLAVVAFLLELKLPAVQDLADGLLDGLRNVLDQSARGASHDFFTRELERVADLQAGSLVAVGLVSAGYAALESVEMVGLWMGKRWAEYLTVVATVALVPFELYELAEGVSALKVAALVLNLAILVWLVYAKRLFGVRGGTKALEEHVDWAAVLASPCTEGARLRLADSPGSLREHRRPGDGTSAGGRPGETAAAGAGRRPPNSEEPAHDHAP